MPMGQRAVRELVQDQLLPAWEKERKRLDRIDAWLRWDHENIILPREGATREVKALIQLAKTPLLALVVATLTQELYAESFRTPAAKKDDAIAPAWRDWLANKMPARQYALHHAAIAYGHAYVTGLPGENELTGAEQCVMTAKSPRTFLALYRDPANDDWPEFTIEVDRQPGGAKSLTVMDSEARYYLSRDKGPDGRVEFVDNDIHDLGVTPAVRYSPFIDLDGRTDGRVEPFINTAARANKTMFDRLLIQHYNSWKIRTIIGIVLPDEVAEANRTKMKLRHEDFLVAADPATKFGALDETDVTPVSSAWKQDVEALATVSQTPSHTLTGDLINLSAEAIAESRIQLAHLAQQTRDTMGQQHKQLLALADHTRGVDADPEGVIGWADRDSRSLAQAADALVKLKDLGIPLEMLWEDVPGYDAAKVQRARKLVLDGGDEVTRLIQAMDAQAKAAQGGPAGSASGDQGGANPPG
jgi:hypothetical protein